MERIGEKIFRWRYVIGLFLFLLCVVFELHASSFNAWLQWLPGAQPNEELIFGEPRLIRSDEWAVFTPLTLAQVDNPLRPFSYFSTLPRGSLTDTFIVYGQPVWSLAMIFRIFQSGFLFLNAGQGMACFWVGRGIVLFLVTIETGMLLTGKRKQLSVALAALVVFAPMVQWWYAINGFIEILITGQLAVLCVDKYMRTKSYFTRLGLTLVLVWCGGTYILTFYPAWMVSFAYVWLALLIAVILKNKEGMCWKWKDSLLVVLFLILLGGSLGYIFYKSRDCVSAVLNSSYPGKRVSVGGQVAWTSLLSGSNLFFPYRTDMIPFLKRATIPVCELALFMDFFPIGTLFAIYVMIKRRKFDTYLILLFIVDILFTCYTLIPFPEWLAKLTLLSFSSSNRVAETITFIRLLELFRAVGLYAKNDIRVSKKKRWAWHYVKTIVIIFVIAIIGVTMGIVNFIILPDYLFKLDVMIIIAVFFFVGWLVWNSNRNYAVTIFSVFCIVISLFVGATVNPVQKGLNQVKQNPLLVQMKAIDQSDPGIWITEGMGFPSGNIPLLAGVSSLNTTHVYPNLNQWTVLDPQGTQREIYNRYAHISIQFMEQPTSFVLNGTDSFTINLNPDDLDKLNIKYVLSRNDWSQLNRVNYHLELIAQIEGYKIYKKILN